VNIKYLFKHSKEKEKICKCVICEEQKDNIFLILTMIMIFVIVAITNCIESYFIRLILFYVLFVLTFEGLKSIRKKL